MNKTYKIAANFNTVEFSIGHDDLMEVTTDDDYIMTDDAEFILNVEETELIKRILQREYDVLASIKVVNVAPSIKPSAKEITPPSEKQAAWAESLGMKNPMQCDKKEVWEYIMKHK